jgi:hypothetical protein
MSAWYHVYIKNSTTYDFMYMEGSVEPSARLINDTARWNKAPHDIESQLGAAESNAYAFDCTGSNGCTGYADYAILDTEENKKIGTLTLSWSVHTFGANSASASVDTDAVRVTRDDHEDKGLEEVVHHVEVKQGI